MDNKDTIALIIVGTVILMLAASFTLSVVFAYQKKYYKHLQEINTIKETYEQELFKTQLEIKEHTLKNISQEIHDNIGQVLSLANMQLTAIELSDNPYATGKIDKSMELVSKAINDLRNLSKTLDAENIVKIGLVKSIEVDLELIEKSGKFTTSLQILGEEKRIDPSKEIITYRIIQEALNNIIKHSKASVISIILNYVETVLSVSISDNGKGFVTSGIGSNVELGAGIQNMINRAQLIKASLHIDSEPSMGTTVLLSIPFGDSNKPYHDAENKNSIS